jgi:hypothetical protein
VRAQAESSRREPSLGELLLLSLVSYLVFVIVVASLDHYWERAARSSDNPVYISLSAAIRQWNFSGIEAKQFWGLPYATALIAVLTPLSDLSALLLVSLVSSLIAVTLAHRLWGGWVAAFFVIISWDWMQRSLLGGAEPLFMAMLCASFLAARSNRWMIAALFAAGSTTVRPIGVLALAAIAFLLLLRREWGRLAHAALAGAAIGGLYLLPVAYAFGDPLASVNTYRAQDWAGGLPVTLPGLALVDGWMNSGEPLTNKIKIGAWVCLTLVGVAAMISSKQFRALAGKHQVEAVFAALYLLFLFTYNSPRWAWSEFPRFTIPAVPFILTALLDWLPKDRRILWAGAVCSASLAAASTINVRHAFEVLRRLWF